jgi:hypothetical protein
MNRRMPAPRALIETAILIAIVGAPLGTPVFAQAQPGTITVAPTGWHYAIVTRPAAVKGLLVLMPGYGQAPDFSDFYGAPGVSGLPVAGALAKSGIATIMIAPPPGTLFGGADHQQRMEQTLAYVARELTAAPALPIAVAGFSAGGTDAVLLAERCARGGCTIRHTVKAVATVDSPLDFERLWDSAAMTIRDSASGGNVAEAHLMQQAIAAMTGGSPASHRAGYLSASPLLDHQADGGNARWLAHTAVRAYTEPDVQWWIDNRLADYHQMNSTDAAALVKRLRMRGNAGAELITTTGKGYRADGRRHPHSWSIVDQAGLAAWVAHALGT